MRTILAVMAVVAGLLVVRANAEDWRQNKAWMAEYQDAKAAASTAADFEKLATLPHATRAGNEWVGAWAVQTAAWRYHESGDRTNAERCAKSVVENPKALAEAKAKAHTILAHGLAAAGGMENWQQAVLAYDDALELDPNLESAKRGKALVEKALRSKSGGS